MKLERRRTGNRSVPITRVMSFTSGKGGVGKTHTVINIATALAQRGRSVLVLDADLGLANVNVMFGLEPKLTLEHLFAGTHALEEIMIDGPGGISIIPAASGVESICTLDIQRRMALMQAVEEVAYEFDYLLIDTQAGIGPDVLHFNSAASEVVCIINPEPTSLTDAYALIKVLAGSYGEKSIAVVANDVRDELEGQRAFQRLARSVERFLHVELRYLGHIPSDAAVVEAVQSQRALLEIFPSSRAGLALRAVADTIDATFRDQRVKGGMQFFFEQLLTLNSHGG